MVAVLELGFTFNNDGKCARIEYKSIGEGICHAAGQGCAGEVDEIGRGVPYFDELMISDTFNSFPMFTTYFTYYKIPMPIYL